MPPDKEDTKMSKTDEKAAAKAAKEAEAKKAAEQKAKEAQVAAEKAKKEAEKIAAQKAKEAEKAAAKAKADAEKAQKAADREKAKAAKEAEKAEAKAAREKEREEKRKAKEAEREARKNQPRQPKPWVDLPAGGKQQAPREGSVLHRCLELIEKNKGATLEEMQALIGEKHQIRRLLAWGHRERGYGFVMVNGKIKALAPNLVIPTPKAATQPSAN